MDNSATKSLSLALLLGVSSSCLHAQEHSGPLTISVDAESSSLDRLSKRAQFKGLRIAIAQENINISANDATVEGFGEDRSQWQFSGNVALLLDGAELHADNAVFRFGDEQVILGELSGSPATFQAQGANNDEPVVGSASRVYYDNSQRTVRLEGGVSLTAGPNRITGCDVIYDLNLETVDSGISDCGEPFRITIISPAEDESRAAP